MAAPARGAPAPLEAAIKGCCPRCGSGPLFAGLIRFAPRCTACGLDFQAFNVGDGAATFLILIVGAIVTVLAVSLELSRSPPWWVHALLWVPLTIMLTLVLLRFSKALLLGQEYRHKAGEGRQ